MIRVDQRQLMSYGRKIDKKLDISKDAARRRSFLRKEGSKLRVATRRAYRTSGIDMHHVKPKKYENAKHAYDTIKRGKPYVFVKTDAIRAYSYSPHMHLLEYGHRIVIRGVDIGRKTRAFEAFAKSKEEFDHTYMNDVRKYFEGTYGKW